MGDNRTIGVVNTADDSAPVARLSRDDLGVLVEAVRYAAETGREAAGKEPRQLNRIGAALCAVAGWEWKNE